MKGPFRAEGLHWWLADSIDSGRLTQLVRAAQLLDSGGLQNEKQGGRRKALYRVALEGDGGADHLIKLNRYRPTGGVRRRLRGSKARHELAMAEACAARGVATPVPVAAAEERRAGVVVRCLLFVPILPEVHDLRTLCFDAPPPASERRRLSRAFGAFCRQVHEAGVFQDDFATNNFLVRWGPPASPPALWMIDFERARLLSGTTERQRLQMLTKLQRELPRLSLAERWRFLLAYAGGRDEARRWWRSVESEMPRLARHDHRRMARTVASGRRYRRLSDGDWRGFGRRDADLVALREARGAEPEEAGLPSPGGPERVGAFWRVPVGGGRRAVWRAWVMMNFLHVRRGLAPLPLACWTRGREGLLLLEGGPSDRLEDGRADDAPARRVLLRRLAALGSLTPESASAPVLLRPGPATLGGVEEGPPPEALWLVPRGLRVGSGRGL